MYSIAKCCSPIPGEPIVGVVTRSKGVSVHRADCKTLANIEPERMMDIHWSGENENRVYTVAVRIETAEKMGILKDIIAAVSDNETNILYANVKSKPGKVGIVELGLELDNVYTYRRVILALQAIPDVFSVKRIQSSAHSAPSLHRPQKQHKNGNK